MSSRRGAPTALASIAGIPVTEDQWWEKSPIFSGLNTNKRGIDARPPKRRGPPTCSAAFIATCDVIVENFTPRVVDQMGLDFPAVQAIRPDIVMLRMPGFGLDGPWRDNPAFAYVIEAASGISWLTGYPDRNPNEPYSVGEPMRAFTHSMPCWWPWNTGAAPERKSVEAAMVDAALNVAAEQVIEHSANGALLERDGNRGPAAAPQNLYRTTDIDEFGRADCWVAVAVATDEQWEALPGPRTAGWAIDPALSTVTGSRTRHDVIDEHLAAWCEGGPATTSSTPCGATVCRWPRSCNRIVRPRFRNWRPAASSKASDTPVNARTPHSTLPFTFSRGPERVHVQPAPLLGQHDPRAAVRARIDRRPDRAVGGRGRDRKCPGDGSEQGQDGLASTGGHRSVRHPADRPRRRGNRRGSGYRPGHRRGTGGVRRLGRHLGARSRHLRIRCRKPWRTGPRGRCPGQRAGRRGTAAHGRRTRRGVDPGQQRRRRVQGAAARTPRRTAGMRCTRATFAMCCCARSGWRAAWWRQGCPAAS